MVKISKEKSESWTFYKYLCQKIGSEEVVRIRRLASTLNYMGESKSAQEITSGSIGEGLKLKGSDLDIMTIDPFFKVYESETEANCDGRTIPLIMNTEETQPCFTQLCLLKHHHEETDPNFWRPNNIITCFMACLERLLYCVRYSILSHYFIPDNNLFYLRFTSSNKEKLITILTNLYEQGIDCFAYSKTLQGYKRKSCEITESFTSGNRILEQQIMAALFPLPTENVSKSLQYHLLHHSRTGLCKEIFALYISKAYAFASQFSEYQSTSENKHYYFMYKHDLSHLLIGLQSDAVSVLLMLASFFYVHKNYLASLTVVKHALQKYTDEKIYTVSFGFTNTLNDTQKYVLKLMKNEKIYTVLKSVTIYPLRFHWMSAIIPQELQRDVADIFTIYHPLAFAHFLSFLCYYHLHDIVSCRHSLQQIESKIKNSEREEEHHSFLCTYIFCGIAHQLMGDTNLAKKLFHQVVEFDDRNATSAAQRLSSLM
ncbi:uncharacterized protein [Mytilus edulis]|uniref:uncharacterized protein n=1 Tax=Mytilus edulis TaxID=6550 RepID=UPI0039EEA36F